jgi:hypothetical protein
MADTEAVALKLTLESDAGSRELEATAAAVEDVFAHLPEGDWYLMLERGDDDFMEVECSGGKYEADCEAAGVYQRTMSYVDAEAAKAMLLSFLEGGEGWRDLGLWKAPDAKAAKRKAFPVPAIFGIGFAILFFAGALIGSGPYMIAVFALAFPWLIAAAATAKQMEAKRVASWTKGSARITRSEMGTETRNGKTVEVPRVEYEFSLGFHKFRGTRVSLAEYLSPEEAKAVLQRYRVGTGTTVYYDAADPGESVIERDLPKSFQAIWIVVAVLVAVIVAGGWWFGFR